MTFKWRQAAEIATATTPFPSATAGVSAVSTAASGVCSAADAGY